MNMLVAVESSSLPSLIRKAAAQLAAAESAGEILEAQRQASDVYDAAKKAARLAKAKGAHDDLIAAAHRAQADALEIEAAAKRRLADEYDAAQERGEVVGAHDGARKRVPEENAIAPATAAEIGLTRKDIHEARQYRDAEVAEPGIVAKTVTERLAQGHEPTRSAVRQAIAEAAKRGAQAGGRPTASKKNPHYVPNPIRDETIRVVDACRAITDVMERRSVDQLLNACIDEDERRRVLKAIRAGAAHLSNFMTEINADA